MSGHRKPSVRICGDVAFLGIGSGREAIIDAVDVPAVGHMLWVCITRRGLTYVRSFFPDGKSVALHRFLLDAPIGLQVDHINCDTLDNRRSNLRLSTHAGNQRNRRLSRLNTSGYKGVSWNANWGKWVAHIKVDGKTRHLGGFSSAQDAHAAYVAAARQLHGEFARVA